MCLCVGDVFCVLHVVCVVVCVVSGSEWCCVVLGVCVVELCLFDGVVDCLLSACSV